MNTKLSLPYIAGLLDGEGTITLTKKGKRFAPRLSIAQSNKEYLEMICKYMGGFGGVYHQKGSECWSWVVGARGEVDSILSLLELHLILKQDQAILVREFISLNKDLKYGEPYSEDSLMVVSKIRELNRKPSLSTNFAS